MTSEDAVLRMQAKLAMVERRSQMAIVTFTVPIGREVDVMANNIGEPVLLGVLIEANAPTND